MLCKLNQSYKVYKNNHLSKNGNVYSILYKNKLLTHSSNFLLKNCKFKVSESGRNRVIKNKIKNVHAFIIGEYSLDEVNNLFFSQISYNPYINSQFQCNTMDINECFYVRFSEQGVTAYFS